MHSFLSDQSHHRQTTHPIRPRRHTLVNFYLTHCSLTDEPATHAFSVGVAPYDVAPAHVLPQYGVAAVAIFTTDFVHSSHLTGQTEI